MTIELLRKNRLQRLVDKRGLATAGNTGNANQLAQRELHIHILQIITLGATQPQTVSIALATLGRHLNGTLTIQVLGSQRMRP